MSNIEQFTGKYAVYESACPRYGEWVVNSIAPYVIADVGAGTGFLTKDLLENTTATIYAVEPNDDMYDGLCKNLSEYIESGRLRVFKRTAEDTGIMSHSVDMVTAAMALHWFDLEKFYDECKRIIKPSGILNLIYNSRDKSNDLAIGLMELFRKTCPKWGGGFTGGYSTAMKAAPSLFSYYEVLEKDNPLPYTIDSWIERNLSSSYAPRPDDDTYTDFVNGLKYLFIKYGDGEHIIQKNKLIVIRGVLK